MTLTGRAIQADGALGTAPSSPFRWHSEASSPSRPATASTSALPSVRARGANQGGGPQAGGDILVRSYKRHVVGAASGELNAGGGGGKPTPNPGTVTLAGCDTPPRR